MPGRGSWCSTSRRWALAAPWRTIFDTIVQINAQGLVHVLLDQQHRSPLRVDLHDGVEDGPHRSGESPATARRAPEPRPGHQPARVASICCSPRRASRELPMRSRRRGKRVGPVPGSSPAPPGRSRCSCPSSSSRAPFISGKDPASFRHLHHAQLDHLVRGQVVRSLPSKTRVPARGRRRREMLRRWWSFRRRCSPPA